MFLLLSRWEWDFRILILLLYSWYNFLPFPSHLTKLYFMIFQCLSRAEIIVPSIPFPPLTEMSSPPRTIFTSFLLQNSPNSSVVSCALLSLDETTLKLAAHLNSAYSGSCCGVVHFHLSTMLVPLCSELRLWHPPPTFLPESQVVRYSVSCFSLLKYLFLFNLTNSPPIAYRPHIIYSRVWYSAFDITD